jgi:hypothetical protein
VTGRAWGLFAAVSILWGVPYLLIKIVSPHLSAPALAWARVAIAAALLLPLACGLRVLPALRGSWHRVAVVGIIEIAAPFTLIAHGEHQVDSSTAGILIATEPILVAVLALVCSSGCPASFCSWDSGARAVSTVPRRSCSRACVTPQARCSSRLGLPDFRRWHRLPER